MAVSGTRVNQLCWVVVTHSSPAELTVIWNTALPVEESVPPGAALPQSEVTCIRGNAPWKFCVTEVAPSADAGVAKAKLAKTAASRTITRRVIRVNPFPTDRAMNFWIGCAPEPWTNLRNGHHGS